MIMCTRPPAGRLVASRYSRGLLADRTPPYLSNKPVGLVSTAGGVQGLQTINSMDFIARALRAWSVPLVLPVPHSRRSFDPDGNLGDEAITAQLRALRAEAVRAARQFQTEGSCDYADDRQFQPDGAARVRKCRASRRCDGVAGATTISGRGAGLP